MSVSVVFNNTYGGFSLSRAAVTLLRQRGKNIDDNGRFDHDINEEIARHDPDLIFVVETLGWEASGDHAQLTIFTLSGRRYVIHEYDGLEWVVEPHDIHWIVVP